ncbi:hypothetical protein BJ912DRAFT_1001087 [Pholiota molesta]|nr:hypothetical protein BJ912DRAFT_1001087 [Pholiota molesta]
MVAVVAVAGDAPLGWTAALHTRSSRRDSRLRPPRREGSGVRGCHAINLLPSPTMSITNSYKNKSGKMDVRRDETWRKNDVVAFELKCIAFVAFVASLFAVDRRSVADFHVLDEILFSFFLDFYIVPFVSFSVNVEHLVSGGIPYEVPKASGQSLDLDNKNPDPDHVCPAERRRRSPSCGAECRSSGASRQNIFSFLSLPEDAAMSAS